MRRLTRASITALAVIAAACSDHVKPIVAPEGPGYQINDAAHAGKPHFFFLPPMVANPAATGAFDPDLSPSVEICAVVGDACGAVIASFTSGGTGSESVRLTGDHYMVNWHTRDFDLDPAVTYRIRALVGNVELGFADVDVVSNGSQLKNVNTGEFIALQDGRTLPIKFRVEAGFPAQVDVTPNPASVVVTLTQQFQAVLRDLHGNALPDTVFWESADDHIAMVDQSGLATGVAGGSVEIRARAQGVTGNAALTVVAVARIAVAPASATAAPGHTQQFTATLYDASDNVITGPAVTWSSSADAIATVDTAGLATAVAFGVATIQATAAGVSASATFDVNGLARIEVTPEDATAQPGETQQFVATLYDAHDNVMTGPTVTWSSSATAVATVNQAGLATAVAAGDASIEASADGITGNALLTVAVAKPPEGIAAMPLDPSWSQGFGTDVNDDGVVVGYLYPLAGASQRRAFRWSGLSTDAPEVLPTAGATWCEAWGIGNMGTIVGTCAFAGEGARAVTWTGSSGPDRLPFVTSLVPGSTARDIHEDATVMRITGSMFRNFNYTCSFPPCTSAGSNPVIWTGTGGALPTNPPTQLGWFGLLNTPGGSGYAINAAGHVSGQRTTVIQYVCGAQCFNYAEVLHGFRSATGIGDLGVAYIYPYNLGTSNGLGINSADVVVGYIDDYANTSNNATRHEAARWPTGAASRTGIPGVPSSLVASSEAQDINDLGWIVGFYGANAFVWKNAGNAEVLEPLATGKAATAAAISQVKNNVLYIAGSAIGADNRRVPARWPVSVP